MEVIVYIGAMPAGSTLLVFSGVALALLLVPGPAVIYIVTTAATQGRRAGLASVGGIHVGTMVHIAAALVGLSAIIVSSSTAFTVVKLAGALYLVVVGVRMLFRRSRDEEAIDLPRRSRRSMFTKGFVVNVLNPKTAVFFLAFVPQFVEVGSGNETTQLLVLGVTFVGLGLITDGLYALAAGTVGPRILNTPRIRRRKDHVAGAIYVTLGVTAALAGPTKG
jgi:threonine/homoserine/homoserine lactone efflux protein